MYTSKLSNEDTTALYTALPPLRREKADRCRGERRTESLAAAALAVYGLESPPGEIREVSPAELTGGEFLHRLAGWGGDWSPGPGGKPFPCGVPVAGGKRRFLSLSHTPGIVAVAVGEREIGADVQRLPAAAPEVLRKMAERFHPAERARLTTLDRHELAGAFCRCWCIKESIAKLAGGGLPAVLRESIPLERDGTWTARWKNRAVAGRLLPVCGGWLAAAWWNDEGKAWENH